MKGEKARQRLLDRLARLNTNITMKDRIILITGMTLMVIGELMKVLN